MKPEYPSSEEAVAAGWTLLEEHKVSYHDPIGNSPVRYRPIGNRLYLVEFKEFRADGWPYCPCCEEEELVSEVILWWRGEGKMPTAQDCLKGIFKCLWCGKSMRQITEEDRKLMATLREPKYTPSEEVLKKIANNFTYHAPFGDQADRYEIIRTAFRELALLIVHNCPESRERSVALTELETACFWSNAGIARNEKKDAEQAESKTA